MRRLLAACAVALLAAFVVSLGDGASESLSQGRRVPVDLLPGEQWDWSIAVDVNERGQVIVNAGLGSEMSDCDSGYLGRISSRALLWERGRVTPLGTLDGGSSCATAINDRGEIVGSSAAMGGGSHAFLWRRGRMIDLGTLPGHTFSVAVAINDRGEVLVDSYASHPLDTGEAQVRSFLWRNGKRRELGPLAGAVFGRGMALNERGQVAGLSGNDPADTTRWRAFLWDAGHTSALPAPRGRHFVADLNDAGDVVGTVGDRAVLWRNDRVTVLGKGSASAIDNRGRVVFGTRLWQRGRSVDLGMTGTGLNERAQVIGIRPKRWRTGSGTYTCQRAYVWHDGQAVELGALQTSNPCSKAPHAETYARALSDAGLVVGLSGSYEAGYRAALWARGG